MQLTQVTEKLAETSAELKTLLEEAALNRPWKQFWFNFLIGIARGFGFFIGATVVVAIVVWIVARILTQIPYIGAFFETLKEFFSDENLKNLQSGQFIDTLSKMFEAYKANLLQNL